VSAPITTAEELAALVEQSVPKRYGPPSRIHPATRVFQALRIAVNDELGNLDALLASLGDASAWLSPVARVGVISFHSLEDRAVKQAFASLENERAKASRKPIEPSEDEIARNPRSRSAKMRVLTRSASRD
jgi:16S rRNA (cytosine1402-N4)-methyltransferase